MELHQPWTVLAMVEAEMGITVLPALACPLHAYPGLVSRAVVEPVVEREVGLVTATGRPLGPEAGAFRDALVSFAAGHALAT
jgi:DNA-binding transcriptional LysR family regulator